MATKKVEKTRETLNKELKAQFPNLFKKAKGGPRKPSEAFLAMLSPALRASVLAELKKAQAAEEAPYTAEEIGEAVIKFFREKNG